MTTFRAQMQAIGTKTSVIIGLLILFYSVPLITLRQYYPILVFNMFAEVHTETEGVVYWPYAIDQNGTLLSGEAFDSWPIRRTDIHNSVDHWVRSGLTESPDPHLGSILMSVTRKQHPEYRIKCYGITQSRWPLNAPLDQRKTQTQSKKWMEYCDEK